MISVIIPAFNSEQFIVQAIESVFFQTYQNFELIVVDDGSRDNTRNILENYKDTKNISLISQKNQGAAAARNAGIKSSRGDYISFLDSDDVWLPRKLEVQKKCIESKPKIGVVYSDWSTFDENGIIEENFPLSRKLPRPSGDIFNELIGSCLLSTITVMIKKEVFNDVGYFDEHLVRGEDYDLWLRIAAKHLFVYCPGTVAMYRQRSGSLTHSITKAKDHKPDELMVINNTLERYPEKRKEINDKKLKRRYSDVYFQRGYSAYYRGDFRLAKNYFRSSIVAWPLSLKAFIYSFIATFFPETSLSVITGCKNVRNKLHHKIL